MSLDLFQDAELTIGTHSLRSRLIVGTGKYASYPLMQESLERSGTEAVHHIDDRLNYLAHIDRALGLGGRLVIVDYREGELPVGPPPGHKLSRDALVQELAKAGWSLTSESPMLPYQYVLVFHPPAGEQPATR